MTGPRRPGEEPLPRPSRVAAGSAVRVYWNSHRRVFSAVAGSGRGKVVAHAPAIGVVGPRFVVRPGGRERARRTGRKAPHAYVAGAAGGRPRGRRAADAVRVGYDPFRDDAFVDRATGRPVAAAEAAYLRVEGGRPVVLAWGVSYGDCDG